MSTELEHLHFEVQGRVQKVYFRVYTQKKAEELKLVGYVQNTTSGTVIGEAQGPSEGIAEFRHWLETTGSPNSNVTSARFQSAAIDAPTFTEFVVDRSKVQRFTW